MNLSLKDAKLTTSLFFRLLPIQILLASLSYINNIVSSLFATNYVGAEAMSAIGLYSPINMFLFAMGSMLVGGSMLLYGKYMGQNQPERTQSIFNVDILSCIVLSGVTIFLLVFAAATGLTRTMTSDPLVLSQLNQYCLGIAIGILPMMLGQQLSAFLSLENQSKRTSTASIAFIIVNLILHFVLVAKLRMGALGLALAASIGQWVFLLIQAQYFFSSKSSMKLGLKGMRMADSIDIIKTGYPGALSHAYQTIRGFIVNALILSYVGTGGLSAFSACNTFLTIFWSVPIGMVTVSRMLIGISMGEEDRKTLTDVMRVMFLRCVPLQCLISAALILLAVPLAKLYFHDPSDPIFQMTVDGFRILPICMPLSIICMHFVCYAQASGKQVLVHILSLLDGVVCVAGYTALLIPFIGLNAIYHANTLNGLTCIAAIIVYSCAVRKKFPHTLDELMVIPDDFGVPEKDRIDINVTKMEEVITVSRQVSAFCREHKMDERRSYLGSLMLEEMAGNVVAHGFTKDKKDHSVDIRVTLKNDDMILRIKDDCIPFDPAERLAIINPDDPTRNLGIKLVFDCAKDIQHQNILGLNVLTIRI